LLFWLLCPLFLQRLLSVPILLIKMCNSFFREHREWCSLTFWVFLVPCVYSLSMTGSYLAKYKGHLSNDTGFKNKIIISKFQISIYKKLTVQNKMPFLCWNVEVRFNSWKHLLLHIYSSPEYRYNSNLWSYNSHTSLKPDTLLFTFDFRVIDHW